MPATGYCEWDKLDGAKIPQLLHGDGVLAMAGLYELWPDPSLDPDDPHRWVWTVTGLTTNASDVVGHVHERSPVVVPAGMDDDWLDPHVTDPGRVRELLAAVPELLRSVSGER